MIQLINTHAQTDHINGWFQCKCVGIGKYNDLIQESDLIQEFGL